jgi:hypothetical protein
MAKWKKPTPMPNYIPSKKESEWHKACVDNGVIISPYGIQYEKSKWRIAIAMKGTHKNLNFAPHVYDEDTIWISYYEMCKYYYDKYKK